MFLLSLYLDGYASDCLRVKHAKTILRGNLKGILSFFSQKFRDNKIMISVLEYFLFRATLIITDNYCRGMDFSKKAMGKLSVLEKGIGVGEI
jgi:hypothetical protein